MKRIALVALLLLAVTSAAHAQCLLTFQTETVPEFPLNEPVNFQFEAVSGTEPYKFEIVEGTLPAGLHFTASGRIVGVGRETADTTVFFRVTDAEGCQLTQAFPIRVTQF